MATSKKARRHKFRKLTFKFSKREFEVLEKCAELESTTINKFIKQSIRKNIDYMMPRLKTWLDQVQPDNQLKLFSEEDEQEVVIQTNMMEEYDEFYESDKNVDREDTKPTQPSNQNSLPL
jgi:hypothetical protein